MPTEPHRRETLTFLFRPQLTHHQGIVFELFEALALTPAVAVMVWDLLAEAFDGRTRVAYVKNFRKSPGTYVTRDFDS